MRDLSKAISKSIITDSTGEATPQGRALLKHILDQIVCYAEFPCDFKWTIRNLTTSNGNYYRHQGTKERHICRFRGNCNQQHDNLPLESLTVLRDGRCQEAQT